MWLRYVIFMIVCFCFLVFVLDEFFLDNFKFFSVWIDIEWWLYEMGDWVIIGYGVIVFYVVVCYGWR